MSSDRWYAPAWTMLPIAARRCRVRNPFNGVAADLDANQHAVLASCEGCRTLEEHLAVVRDKLGVRPEDLAAIQAWLQAFAAQGLLVPEADLTLRLTTTSAREPAPCAGIFIRTCDRPKLLARVLESVAARSARGGRRERVIVLDDSRDAQSRAANRDAAARHASLDVRHVDLSAPTALERELRRRVPHAGDAIDWLLGPPTADERTYGRPLNFALLMSAGRRVLLLDDDALLDPRGAPMRGEGFDVSSTPDELLSFADEAALDAACPALDFDPLAAHLDRLGQPVFALWSAASGGPQSLALDAGDYGRFMPSARVLFTQNHAMGDPGSALFPYHLLALPPKSRARLLQDPSWRQHAFTTRIDWRGQPRARLALRRTFTCTTLAGIDNSVMIPPTARAHRNEDLLLGEMAQHVHTDGWFFDLPWGLPHRREPAKRWLDPSASFTQEPVHFLMEHVHSRAATVTSEQPEDRLRALGALLLDLAGASHTRLTTLLEEQAADTATRALFSIDAQLDDPSLPGAWKDALRPWLASPALSLDPAALRARIAPLPVVRELAEGYGRALVAWPELWTAARDLAERGAAT